MLKNLFAVVLAAVVAAGIGYADQSASTVVVKTPKTEPTNGREMYMSYCSSCHGVAGKGNGPAAAALKTRPMDLTALSKNNGGKFPSTHVVSVLQFGAASSSHGSAEMPVWGPLFGKMNVSNPQEETFRIGNLNRYLETIQAK